jgi:flagellar basal-body rod modification protein FlgD
MIVSAAAHYQPPAAVRKPGANLDKDAFMQLLVTQLRNQDPLSPMDPEQMASQLAQFSSLEQMIEQNKRFDDLISVTAQQAHIGNTALAASLIGKQVLAEGSAVRVGEDGRSEVMLDVGGQGGNAVVTILDEAGREIARIDLGRVERGSNRINAEIALPAGTYEARFEVLDGDGQKVPHAARYVMDVSGVRFGEGGILLTDGKRLVPMSRVGEVFGPR